MIQKRSIEEAAGRVVHTTKSDRQKDVRETPEEVTVKECAPARSARPIERKVLRKQARKARADHALKCSLSAGKNTEKKTHD